MADWRLAFASTVPTERSVPVEAYAEVVAAAIGAPVTTDVGELSGNPRDMFTRTVSIAGQHPSADVRVTLHTTQWSGWAGDSNPLCGPLYAALIGPASTSAARTAVWHALRDGFARLEYADRTWTEAPATIVDDTEASGDLSAGARLRATIREALVAQAHRFRVVRLVDTRVDDIEAVLAAYPEPETKDEVTFENCKLGALPLGVGRFVNAQALTFIDPGSDISALRKMKLPLLTKLSFERSGVTRLTREDVAGLPSLTELDIALSAVSEIDPGLIDVCPRLTRVRTRSAPLRNFAALRDAWPQITWD